MSKQKKKRKLSKPRNLFVQAQIERGAAGAGPHGPSPRAVRRLAKQKLKQLDDKSDL